MILNIANSIDRRYGTGSDFAQYEADYITLYVDNIRTQVRAEDPYHLVALSSPSNGLETDVEGYVSEWPGDPRFGDGKTLSYISRVIYIYIYINIVRE